MQILLVQEFGRTTPKRFLLLESVPVSLQIFYLTKEGGYVKKAYSLHRKNAISVGPTPILYLRGITKSFPGVIANDHIDLEIYSGEVHALLGENGAGKSTLMKILYGFYRADSGEIRLNDRPVRIQSPHEARQCRIGMVFQDFTLIPAMSVTENIELFLPDLSAVLDKKGMIRRIEEVSKRYDLAVDPTAPVWRLSVGERQKVEVLKLLMADSRILILDEPTRNLAPHEVDGLYRVFANLRRDGYAVVFITHKLKEVLACADRITVMRRGQVSGTIPVSEATEESSRLPHVRRIDLRVNTPGRKKSCRRIFVPFSS